jgi:Na+(H+)/acetate symporter ActP
MLQEGDFSIGKRNGHGGHRLDERRIFHIDGLISFDGYDGAVYLMGWTGGYVLLTLYPISAKIWEIYRSRFCGERYYSNTARTVAVICALVVSFTWQDKCAEWV